MITKQQYRDVQEIVHAEQQQSAIEEHEYFDRLYRLLELEEQTGISYF